MIKLNQARLLDNMEKQGKIGWNGATGLNRLACSEAFIETRNFLKAKMKAIGLEVNTDSVGNIFGLLKGEIADAPIILSGSHLDSVTAGGIYDGNYGVFAALEVAESLIEQNIKLSHSFQVVGFNAEEAGPLGGTFGSRAFSGQVESPPSKAIFEQMGLAGNCLATAKADMSRYCNFLEVHIEQGPVLFNTGVTIGIPTGIVGITRYSCKVRGEANHAGTTPMNNRKDAFYESTLMLSEWLGEMRKKNIVCNIGCFNIENGEAGVVPAVASFIVEIRALKSEETSHASEMLFSILSKNTLCKSTWELLVEKPPVALDDMVIDSIEKACMQQGYSYQLMPSGASHDASPLARVMPTGMIFVPSVNGVSHNKKEYTSGEDLFKGACILATAVQIIDKL